MSNKERENRQIFGIMASTETKLTLGGIAELATRPGCNEPSEKMDKLEQDLQRAKGKFKPI